MPALTLSLSLRGNLLSSSAFDPATLFGTTDTGWFYDLSDMSTLFQDAAGITPVTDVGQPVGLCLDKSKGLVLGPELVATGLTGTPIAAKWTLTGNRAVLVGALAAEAAGITFNGLTGTSGATYRVDVTVYSVAGDSYSFRLPDNSTIGQKTGPQSFSFRVRADGTTALIRMLEWNGNLTDIDFEVVVRELPGNHRSQSASLPRPTYARHPLGGIRNLLTFTEQFDNADWSKVSSTITANAGVAPDGTMTADNWFFNSGVPIVTPALGLSTSATAYLATTNPVLLSATAHTYSLYVKAGSGLSHIQLRASTGSNLQASSYSAIVRLSDGAVVDQASSTCSVSSVGNGWWRIAMTFTPTANGHFFGVWGWNNTSFITNGTQFYTLWGAQLELGSTATPYQRVVSVFDVTEAGQPDLYYLSYDGLNDSLSTAPFAWGSDKATVVAGVRKLSNSIGAICETSANFTTNAGSFAVLSGNNAGGVYSSGVNGTLISGAAFVTQGVAPDTAVITHIGDISGDFVRLRRNSIIGTDSLNDRGTGNFGTYPVFSGARGGTSLFFNGREYSSFGINRLLTVNETFQIERYTGQRAGVNIVSPFKAYALGDSTVAAFAGGTALMQLFDTGYTEIDLSVPGHTIAQQKTAWVNQTIAADETAWVIMQIGLNDLAPAEAASVAIARLQDLADTIKSEIGSKPLLIAQMIPCRQRLINLYGATNGPIAYQKWLDMNAAIAGLGPTPITGVQGRITEHVPLMDDGSGNLRAEFDTGDGIHPNNAGRQVNVTAWRNALGVLGL